MAGPTTITWDDGSPPQSGPELGTVPHTYPESGTYTIHVCDADHPTLCSDVEVTLPFPRDSSGVLEITATQDPGDPATYEFQITGAREATTEVDFGDGTTPATVPTPNGSGTVDHTYTRGA